MVGWLVNWLAVFNGLAVMAIPVRPGRAGEVCIQARQELRG